jgi:N-acetylneuraminic acid mutarotase
MTVPARIWLAGLVLLATAAAGTATVLVAEPATGADDQWLPLASSPLERSEVGAAKIGDRIYVLGGLVADGQGHRPTRAARVYDIGDNAWSQIASMPAALDHAGVAAADGRVYVYGGRGPNRGSRSRLYRYTPDTDAWKRLRDSSIARHALAFAAFGEKLYAAGGATNSNPRARKLEVYDISDRRWRKREPMGVGRNHVAAAFLGGELIVTGGRPGPEHGGRDTVESYDPAMDDWDTKAAMDTARSGHSAAVVSGGRLVVFGGEERDPGGSTIEQAEVYDGSGWESLPPMLTPRHGLGGAADVDRVFALEGGPQPGGTFSAVVEFLDVPAP